MTGMNLLTMSLYGAVLVLVVLILRTLLLYKLPKGTFLVLWYLVLLRLLCPFSFAVPFGGVFRKVRDSGPYLTAFTPSGTQNQIPVDFAVPAAYVTQGAITIPWTAIWLLGVGLCALFFLLSYLRCLRGFRESLPVDNAFTRRWLAEHPLGRPIAVRQSDRIAAPLSYGVLSPVILLPKSIDWTDEATLAYVFQHEYVHIRRFDLLGKLAAAAALCLHWFNPLVWLLYVLLNRDMELSCDEAVVRRSGSRGDYARTLIRMEEVKSGLHPFLNHFSKTEERIVAIMKTKKLSTISVLLAGLLVTGVAVCGFTVAVDRGDGTIQMTTMDSTGLREDSAWVKERLAEWKKNLKPYAPFGVTCEYDAWTDNVRLYYQGKEVRGIYDAQRQVFLSEHTGGSTYSAGAIDLYAVYENGRLTGLREGTPEEKAQQDRLRYKSSEVVFAEYEPYGLIYHSEDNTLYFNGKRVRQFTDRVYLDDSGSASRCDFYDEAGEIDVYTVRGTIDNGDGSVDPFGYLQSIQVSIHAGAFDWDDVLTMDDAALDQYAVYSGDTVEEGTPFAEEFAPYREHGLTFKQEGETGVGNVYLYGKLVNTFVDKKPGGGVFSFQSKDKGGFNAQTLYDRSGKLIGIERVR